MLYRALQITTGILCGLALVAVLLTTGAIGPDGVDVVASPFEPYPAPPLDLPNADGSPFSMEDTAGQVALVFFGFANCPDVCPITLSTWTRALEELGGTATFQGIFVTVDPSRDTPEVLESWMRSFDPSIRALRGSDAEARSAAADWGIYVGRVGLAEGMGSASAPATSGTPGGDAQEGEAHEHEGYLVEHSAQVFVVDREGRVVRILPPAMALAQLVAALEPILES